jgi:hypothetical protein
MLVYKSIKDYLHRFTLLRLGRLHIRIHSIKSEDITPFQHTHPFNYISIILSGGYVEKIRNEILTHKTGKFLFRSHSTPHRISQCFENTRTLFIAWSLKTPKWHFEDFGDTSPCWINYPIGVYKRELFGKVKFCKFDRYWHKAAMSREEAWLETQPSIDQQTGALP